ncbi:hypothetical protein B0T14DRAFT_563918 [Immersiella caudata]|uniref:Uncharacterized protein n=1 Tax=Immersiella caudata TaxID=314043 RepID=A0AA39WVM6_9PEZI|nr:hypothetical protein B0T14DRAFT_563918 [Immersiella caudata]
MAGNISSPIANWTLLDFDYDSDCTRAAGFWTSYYNNGWNAFVSLENFPYAQFIDFVQNAAPDPFANVSRGVIVDWIDNLNFTIKNGTNWPWQYHGGLVNCEPEVCYQLNWEGNPDLAGIGVLLSYAIEVVLATVFVFVLGPQYLHRLHESPSRTHRAKTPIWAAFQTSLGLFWDTALLFNLAVTVAALVAVAETRSMYINDFARMSSAVTWSAIALAWPLYRPTCHHRRARGFGLFIASALCAALMWCEWDNSPYGYANHEGSTFEWLCYQKHDGSTDMRITGETMGVIVVYLTGSMTSLYVALWLGLWALGVYYRLRPSTPSAVYQAPSPASSSSTQSPRKRWTRGILVMVWMVVAFTLMQLSLVAFIFKRAMTAVAAGPTFQGENRWGFGQVMSLAVWFPTAMDFLLIIRGNLRALKYRLPRGVDVMILDQSREAESKEGVTDSVEGFQFQQRGYGEQFRPPRAGGIG